MNDNIIDESAGQKFGGFPACLALSYFFRFQIGTLRTKDLLCNGIKWISNESKRPLRFIRPNKVAGELQKVLTVKFNSNSKKK